MDLVIELRALGNWVSGTLPVVQEATRRPASSAADYARLVVVPSEKVADFQRSHDTVMRELGEAVHALKGQRDILAAWRARCARHVAAVLVVIALLLGSGIGLALRAHALAKTTHDILAQILENQERALAAKTGRHR